MQVIALRAPMADDLREVVAALKIAGGGRADRRLCQEHRQARAADRERAPDRARLDPARDGPDGRRDGPRRARRLCRARRARRRSRVMRARRGARRLLRQHLPHARHLHGREPARRSARSRTCCSSPRTSSGSAITRPTSPRWSISPRRAPRWPTATAASHATAVKRLSRWPAPRCCWSKTMPRSPSCSSITSSARISTSRQTPDGEEALLLAKERAPDIVLLDWMVEGLSGIEVCRRLRRDARDRERADHHAHRARRGGGPRARAGDRRRRLRHQAVLPARAGRPRRRGAAPRPPGARRRGADLCRHRDGYRRPQGAARRRSRCRSARPNSGCSSISWNIPAGSSRASGCSTRSGATTATSRARTVDVHIRRLRKAINIGDRPDIIRTVRSAGYSLDTAE